MGKVHTAAAALLTVSANELLNNAEVYKQLQEFGAASRQEAVAEEILLARELLLRFHKDRKTERRDAKREQREWEEAEAAAEAEAQAEAVNGYKFRIGDEVWTVTGSDFPGYAGIVTTLGGTPKNPMYFVEPTGDGRWGAEDYPFYERELSF